MTESNHGPAAPLEQPEVSAWPRPNLDSMPPEVLVRIFNELENEQTALFALRVVCKTLAPIARGQFLIHPTFNSPDDGNDARSISFRQRCEEPTSKVANDIQTLTFRKNTWFMWLSGCSPGRFPRLEQILCLGVSESNNEDDFDEHARLSLADILPGIAESCPKLQRLVVHSSVNWYHPYDPWRRTQLEFSMPNLIKLELTTLEEFFPIPEEFPSIFEHLSTISPDLESLSLTSTAEIFASEIQHLALFESLTSLTLCVDPVVDRTGSETTDESEAGAERDFRRALAEIPNVRAYATALFDINPDRDRTVVEFVFDDVTDMQIVIRDWHPMVPIVTAVLEALESGRLPSVERLEFDWFDPWDEDHLFLGATVESSVMVNELFCATFTLDSWYSRIGGESNVSMEIATGVRFVRVQV